MRLFTAIELSASARQHLQGVISQLSAKTTEHSNRWTKPDNLHVTLKFLGEVEDPQIPNLIARLATVRVERASAYADRLLLFPPRGPARVIAAGLGGEIEMIARLFGRIEDVCTELGFPRERRKFVPHITLGRGRPKGDGILAADKIAASAWPGPTFVVESLVVMQSALSPGGSVYTPVARFPKARHS